MSFIVYTNSSCTWNTRKMINKYSKNKSYYLFKEKKKKGRFINLILVAIKQTKLMLPTLLGKRIYDLKLFNW